MPRGTHGTYASGAVCRRVALTVKTLFTAVAIAATVCASLFIVSVVTAGRVWPGRRVIRVASVPRPLRHGLEFARGKCTHEKKKREMRGGTQVKSGQRGRGNRCCEYERKRKRNNKRAGKSVGVQVTLSARQVGQPIPTRPFRDFAVHLLKSEADWMAKQSAKKGDWFGHCEQALGNLAAARDKSPTAARWLFIALQATCCRRALFFFHTDSTPHRPCANTQSRTRRLSCLAVGRVAFSSLIPLSFSCSVCFVGTPVSTPRRTDRQTRILAKRLDVKEKKR